MTVGWKSGWPYDADPEALVEVEYRNGRKEIAKVCEIDWSKPDDKDPYSAAPENEAIRYRLVSA